MKGGFDYSIVNKTKFVLGFVFLLLAVTDRSMSHTLLHMQKKRVSKTMSTS